MRIVSGPGETTIAVAVTAKVPIVGSEASADQFGWNEFRVYGGFCTLLADYRLSLIRLGSSGPCFTPTETSGGVYLSCASG